MERLKKLIEGIKEDSSYFHSGDFHGNWSDYNVKVIVRDLKDGGVKAKAGYSGYVGHNMLMIHQDDFSKGLDLLKKQGYVDECEELKDFYKNFKSEYNLK